MNAGLTIKSNGEGGESAGRRVQPAILGGRRLLLVCAVLFASVLGTFVPALNGDFVEYDDSFYVTANPHITSGLTGANVVWGLTAVDVCNWHPLTWWSHMLDWQLYGPQAWGHHLSGILLHAASTVLVFLVFWRMTRRVWPSVMLAALFGLHPMRVESVAWISERKDVLGVFFWLLTLLCYSWFVEKADARERGAVRFYALALVCFALGLMSKPSVVTLPFALLLLDYWPLNRFGQRGWRRLLLEKLPFFALTLAACVVTYVVQKKGGVMEHLAGLPLGVRLENAAVCYVRYILKLIWPANLCALYPHPVSWPAATVAISLAALSAISITAILLARRLGWLLIGWLWFLGTLVPMAGFVQVGTQSMADRYSYIASLGIFIGMVWGAATALRACRRPVVPAAVSVLAAAACVGLTRHQLTFWRDGVGVWGRAVAVTGNNYDAQNRLGRALAAQGRVPEAIIHFEEVTRLKPDYIEGWGNYGKALALAGRLDEAIAAFRRVISLEANHVVALGNLGNLHLRNGELDRAAAYCRQALQIDPAYAPGHSDLGYVLYLRGELAAARAHFQRAVDLRPGNLDARNNLGSVCLRLGDVESALREFRIVANAQPDSAEAHNNLGSALLAINRADEAVGEFMMASRLQPNSPELHRNLGRALEGRGDIEGAANAYREALRIRPGFPEATADLQRLQQQRQPRAGLVPPP